MTSTLLPFLILIFGGLTLCAAGSVRLQSGFWKGIALGVLLLAGLCFSLFTDVQEESIREATREAGRQQIRIKVDVAPTLVQVTSLAALQVWMALSLGILVTMMTLPIKETPDRSALSYGLLLLALAGLVLAAVSRHLGVLILGLELTTVPLYLRAAVLNSGPASQQVLRQQFLLNLVSTLVFLLGASLLFGLTGSLQLPTLSQPGKALFPVGSALSVLAVTLVVFGLGSRLLLLPCHNGLAEFVETASTQQTLSLTVLPRLAAFFALLHLFPAVLLQASRTGQTLLIVLALATMVIGGLLAYQEKDLRRQICYLMLPPAGVWLASLAVTFWEVQYPMHSLGATSSLPNGASLSLLACGLDLFAIVGFLAVLCSLEREGEPIQFQEELAGVARTEPLAAVCAVVFLLSLTGVPPFPGFWGKLTVLLTLLSAQVEPPKGTLPAPHPLFLAAAAAVVFSMFLTAVVASRILVTMCWEFPSGQQKNRSRQPALASAVLLAILFVITGVFPALLIHPFHQVTNPVSVTSVDRNRAVRTDAAVDKEKHADTQGRRSDNPSEWPATESPATTLR